MSKSATQWKRADRTAAAIHRTALEMTDELGFDGWTMDHLAERVGVSRRTLFNHVPGKMDAVLGPEPEPGREVVETFLGGDPTGRVGRDLVAMVRTLLEAEPVDRDEVMLVRRVLTSDKHVQQAAHARLENAAAQFAELLTERERDPVTQEQASVALRMVIVVFDAALDAFIAEPQVGTVAGHFTRIFDDLVELF